MSLRKEPKELEVTVKLTKMDGWYAWHVETITTAVDWADHYYDRTSEIMMLKDFGHFGELEFDTYDWRR